MSKGAGVKMTYVTLLVVFVAGLTARLPRKREEIEPAGPTPPRGTSHTVLRLAM